MATITARTTWSGWSASVDPGPLRGQIKCNIKSMELIEQGLNGLYIDRYCQMDRLCNKPCLDAFWGQRGSRLDIFEVRQCRKYLLTALNGVGRDLQGHGSPRGLVDVNSENHPHPGVLTPDVRLPLSELYVRVAQLQDPRAVDSVLCRQRLKR